MNTRKNILIVSGGPSLEHGISLKSAKNVIRNVNREKFVPRLLILPRRGNWKRILSHTLQKHQPDVVFIAMHGECGEDGQIQALLERRGILFTGSGSRASAHAMDKMISSRILTEKKMDVPKHRIIAKNERPQKLVHEFGLPFVIKPANRGSSVGVAIVRHISDIKKVAANAFRASPRVMAQKYIEGREVTCGVLEDFRTGRPFALPPTEIIPKTGPFFNYRAKYTKGASREITPARLPASVIRTIQKNALAAHTALGCRGMSRTDMIIEKPKFKIQKSKLPKIYVLETNTIPGMTETSLLPQGARAAGISFPNLIDLLIRGALRKK